MKGIEKYITQTLGQDNDFAPQRKEWIAAAIGAATGLASSLIAGNKAAKAANEAEKRQREQEASERAWYNRRYNENYVDTAAGQNLVRRAKDFAKENWKKAAGAQAVAGGTDAATAQAKEAGNKMVGDTIANIAATDQQRKSHVDDLHRQAESQFAQMDMNRDLQRAQNITNAGQAASNALISAGAAIDQAGAGKTSLQGGSNGGVEHTTPLNIPQDKPDNGVVNLQSNFDNVAGDYDVNDLRRKMGIPT